MSKYKWLQQVGGEEKWTLFLADQEERIVRERKPAFTTILAADNDFESEMTADDMAKVAYFGNFYADFDANSIEEVLPQWKKFLTRLRDEHDFDLEQAYLYATGKKGFHCIIDSSCFMVKPPARGVVALPAVYKELAMSLYVDCLDLKTYTGRKGRQLRTPNVERPDKPGVFKVPITPQEALDMTPEMYREFTSAPRHIATRATPTLNDKLALLYTQANDKVGKALKNRKNAKVDEAMLKKFNGDFPPTVAGLMRGENVVAGVGFNKLAMQLSITANALGKSQEEFLASCEGLIANHVSDGNRYNSPEKRRAELIRMFAYTLGNPCYSYGTGAMRSMVDKSVPTPDLDSNTVPTDDGETDEETYDFGITLGVRVSSQGIYKKGEEGMVRACAIGLTNPAELLDIITGRSIGYEVDTFLDGTPKGKRLLDMGSFQSKNKFQQFTLSQGVSTQMSDAQVGALADVLRLKALRANRRVMVTGREGLDLILPADSDGEIDTAWVTKDAVVSRLGLDYRLRGFVTAEGEYKSDLWSAPDLEDTAETREFFDTLFEINAVDVIGRLMGWFSACNLRQFYHHFYGKFPLLQVFGEAGAGKTETTRLLSHQHYYRRNPAVFSAKDLTAYALSGKVAGSASIPLILDEVKFREMDKYTRDRITMALRGSYNRVSIAKGHLNHESGSSSVDIRETIYSAPLVTIGEAMMGDSATLERTIAVGLTKASAEGRKDRFDRVVSMQANKHILGAYGKSCADTAIHLDLDMFQERVAHYSKVVQAGLGKRAAGNDRAAFNIGVVLLGLEFTQVALGKAFGDRYLGRLTEFQDSVIDKVSIMAPRIQGEIAKVLNVMAYLSRNEPQDSPHRLIYGIDYTTGRVNPKKPDSAPAVDLKLRNCYAKYSRWSRLGGQEVLFDTEEAFIMAMTNYAGVVDKACIDNPVLKDNPFAKVFRCSVEHMSGSDEADNDGDGIEFFYEPID